MVKVNWGIIGCGDVTEVKSGPAFYTLPHCSLQAVMRRNEAKAADYALRHNVPSYYTDADQLIHDPKVDAVYVATPPGTHALYAIKALEAGKPVYVEKPMALNEEECRQMVDASLRTGVPLFVAYYRRKMDYFMRIKEIIDKGKIGDVTMANIRLFRAPLPEDLQEEKPWRLNPKDAGGGYFVDMGTHQIDLLLWLFGPLKQVKGFASNRSALYPAEDTVEAMFVFESGVLASGLWNFVAPEKATEDRFEILGTKGRLLFSTFTMDCIRLEVNGVEEFISVHKPTVVEKPMISAVSEKILQHSDDKEALHDAVMVTHIVDQILQEFREKTAQ